VRPRVGNLNWDGVMAAAFTRISASSALGRRRGASFENQCFRPPLEGARIARIVVLVFIARSTFRAKASEWAHQVRSRGSNVDGEQ